MITATDPFNVSMLVLGTMGSLWTTVYTLMEYCFERLETLENYIKDVVFQDVYQSYAVPLLRQKLRMWNVHQDRTPHDV